MTDPKPVGAILTETGKRSRVATCEYPGCDVEIEQMYFLNRWQPRLCPTHAALEAEEDKVVRAREEDARAVKLRLAALGVPKLYASVSLDGDSFQFHGTAEEREIQSRIVRRGRQYLSDWPDIPHEKMLIALQGGPGTGKGHWVWSVAKWITENYPAQVRVKRLADLIREIRATWRKGSTTDEEAVLAHYRQVDLLIIDEVSRHAFYGQSTQHLFDVINDRIEWCRPTILTSNETAEGLTDILGPALTDRLEGSGGLIRFGSASWRSRDRSAA